MSVTTTGATGTHRYTVMLEHDDESWSAYVPSLPGCIAAGYSREEVLDSIRTSIRMHLEGMLEDGVEIPPDDAPDSLEAVSVSVQA